jgi:hypothetical protein
MWELNKLTFVQKQQCLNTFSSNTFLFLVGDALERKEALSLVRMADGEHILMNQCLKAERKQDVIKPTNQLDEAWLKKFGVWGITYEELYRRLIQAAEHATYFAASLSGIIMGHYDVYHFSRRDRYVDNFFNYGWSEEYKIGLMKKAGKVLFIHYNPNSYAALEARAKYIGVETEYIQMSNWTDTDRVIDQAYRSDAPLVLYSAGPGGKIIGPTMALASNTQKVTLDVGSASDRWLLEGLKDLSKVSPILSPYLI